MADDEQSSREHSDRLQEAVRQVSSDRRARDSSEERAREAATEQRKRLEEAGDDD
jgi:hypothetical protein